MVSPWELCQVYRIEGDILMNKGIAAALMVMIGAAVGAQTNSTLTVGGGDLHERRVRGGDSLRGHNQALHRRR